jgi:flagellar biogenesis protein FliO
LPETYEYLKFIASFFIVLVFIYAIYYYLNNFTSLKKSGGKEIEVLETKMIGKNSFLILARIKDRIFLLANDGTGVKILHEWKETQES